MMGKKGDFKVDPWEVSGTIDYGRLVKEFGITPLKPESLPKPFQEEILFRRGTVFAHRDFQKILEAIKARKKFVMMTGLMPSGKFHLGHMILARQFPFYQKLGAKLYVAVADIEAHGIRKKGFDELKKTAIEEYLKNYIALGLKPKNCDFYFQSERSNNAKKSNAYYKMAFNFSNHATFNEFKAVYGSLTPAKINASLIQASDMYHSQLDEFEGPKTPILIPVGADQDPHIRIARGMARRSQQGFIPISSTYHLFLPGLKQGKMSSSDESSFIAMSDNEEDVERKIKKYAFSGGQKSLEEHRKHGGNPNIDVSFQYLKMFFETNDKKLQEIHDDYKSGKLLTGELKAMTIEKISAFLNQHQKKLKVAEKQVGKFIHK